MQLETRWVVALLWVALVGCASSGPYPDSPGEAANVIVTGADAELPSLIGPPVSVARDNGVLKTAPAMARRSVDLDEHQGSKSPAGQVSSVKPASPGETPASPTGAIAADASASAAALATAPMLPSGWEPWILHPSKTKTRYRLEKLEHGMALRADADSSASGLVSQLRVDPAKRPFLEWRWRVDSLIQGADNTDRYAEDAPVRVVLAFDGDKGALPMKDRLFFEQAKFFSGNEMPYATLMYIWENNKPVGSVIHNPNTGRVRKIVVASGPVGLREWQIFRRNIVEDYKLAFGKPPGRLLGVAILTDTDNTKEKVTAWYGDIKLLRK